MIKDIELISSIRQKWNTIAAGKEEMTSTSNVCVFNKFRIDFNMVDCGRYI